MERSPEEQIIHFDFKHLYLHSWVTSSQSQHYWGRLVAQNDDKKNRVNIRLKNNNAQWKIRHEWKLFATCHLAWCFVRFCDVPQYFGFVGTQFFVSICVLNLNRKMCQLKWCCMLAAPEFSVKYNAEVLDWLQNMGFTSSLNKPIPIDQSADCLYPKRSNTLF